MSDAPTGTCCGIIHTVFEIANEVIERSTCTNRWELSMVADENQAAASVKRVNEGSKHVLSQHG